MALFSLGVIYSGYEEGFHAKLFGDMREYIDIQRAFEMIDKVVQNIGRANLSIESQQHVYSDACAAWHSYTKKRREGKISTTPELESQIFEKRIEYSEKQVKFYQENKGELLSRTALTERTYNEALDAARKMAEATRREVESLQEAKGHFDLVQGTLKTAVDNYDKQKKTEKPKAANVKLIILAIIIIIALFAVFVWGMQ